MQWFYNLGQWFLDNKDAIVTWLTGIDVVGLAGMLIFLFKQNKSIKSNTSSTNALNAAMSKNNEMTEAMTSLRNEVSELKAENAKLKKEADDMLHNEELLVTKLNAMLDVQAIVYSTIKDESTRTAVGNILTNAKYAESTKAAKLLEQLKELREQITEQASQSAIKVDETLSKAETLLEENKITTRY